MSYDETPLGMYAARTAARIARVSPHTFRAWARAGWIRPQRIGKIGERDELTYTYDDLLKMRLITRLKEKGATSRSISAALATIEYMSNGNRHAWKFVEMNVTHGLIVVIFPDKENWNPVAASKGPQKLAVAFFPELLNELEKELVPPDRFKNIIVDPEILGGSPTIKGTRLSTRAVASVIESGGEPQEMYPTLTDEQIREVCDYEMSFLQAA